MIFFSIKNIIFILFFIISTNWICFCCCDWDIHTFYTHTHTHILDISIIHFFVSNFYHARVALWFSILFVCLFLLFYFQSLSPFPYFFIGKIRVSVTFIIPGIYLFELFFWIEQKFMENDELMIFTILLNIFRSTHQNKINSSVINSNILCDC